MSNHDKNLEPKREGLPPLLLPTIVGAPIKELIPHLEHPFFGLSKRPMQNTRTYEDGRGNWLKLYPGPDGLPTVCDQDVLIYCCTKLTAERERGKAVERRVRLTSIDMLQFSNRRTDGRAYDELELALNRLSMLRMKARIESSEYVHTNIFGVIDGASMTRKRDRKDRPGALLGCEIILSDWLLDTIKANNILTLHPNYFRLRRPLDRRLYQIGRKHCGLSADRSWEIGLKKLHARSGSVASLWEFRRLVKDFAGRWRGRQFLDYEVDFDPTRDIATFTALPPVPDDPRFRPVIEGRPSPAAMEKARGLAPGYDPYAILSDWIAWRRDRPVPRRPDAAFLGFVRKWQAVRPKLG